VKDDGKTHANGDDGGADQRKVYRFGRYGKGEDMVNGLHLWNGEGLSGQKSKDGVSVSVSQDLKIARNIRARKAIVSSTHPSRVKIIQPFCPVVIMPFLKGGFNLGLKFDLFQLGCEAGGEVCFDSGKNRLPPAFIVGLEEGGIAAHIFGVSFNFAIVEFYGVSKGFGFVC
jgi:hypothetical protein